MAGDEITRHEFETLQRRIEQIDSGGTRGIGAMAVQLTEVIKDVGDLRGALAEHHREHQAEARARLIGRRWMLGTIIAVFAVIETPLLYLVAHLH